MTVERGRQRTGLGSGCDGDRFPTHFAPNPEPAGTAWEASVASLIVSSVTRVFAVPPLPEVRRRLPRLLAGLVLCGVAFACIVDARLGLDPWNVLHEGVADRVDLPIGLVTTLLGFVVLLAWIPLRERIGIGTIANALLIGTVMDLVLPMLPDSDHRATRWGLFAAGLVLIGPGIGLYIGARLGPGPRDGIMTGLARRGPSIRLVRTGIELVALALGWALGGTVGVGTVIFAITVGPNAQFWLERLDLGHPPGFDAVVDPEVDPDPTLATS